MNIIELEQKRISQIQYLDSLSSNRLKLFSLYYFFKDILATQNKAVIEAFLPEFIERYTYLLENTEPYYTNPKIFKSIIEQANEINNFDGLKFINSTLSDSINIINEKYKKIVSILNGNLLFEINNKINFPILEKSNQTHFQSYGFLESFTVSIKKGMQKDNFIIIPSSEILEAKIEKQVQISWEIAISYLKKYKNRSSKFHEVIISFDKKVGFYTGNSLGVALTISFIEQLLLFYNTDYLISTKPGVTITGGINEEHNIIDVSKEIIREKTEIVFYSLESIFVVPKNDEQSAKEKYEELKKQYPKRKLSIIGIENIEDLFNRRNIVEIKKQNYIKKTAKSLRSNWKAAIIIMLLSTIVGFYFIRDFDDNPAILESSSNTLFVKNKSGKVLWTKKMGYDPIRTNSYEYLSSFQKIVDINDDGLNEIILAGENLDEEQNHSELNRIVCIDKNKGVIWNYIFRDTVTTNLQKMDTLYSTCLIDTATIKKRKTLLCIANNSKSYSSAIFQLDLITGERINSTLWNAGFFVNALIKDFNNDGKAELFASFINNGFERIGILVIEPEKLEGQCPTSLQYKYKYMDLANFKDYILLPKTDYTQFINKRTEGIIYGQPSFDFGKGEIHIVVEVEFNKAHFSYIFNTNTKNFEMVIGNDFRVMRDSLVVHGKLKPPLTDTEEYCNILKSQIKYWNGKEFVFRKDLL